MAPTFLLNIMPGSDYTNCSVPGMPLTLDGMSDIGAHE